MSKTLYGPVESARSHPFMKDRRCLPGTAWDGVGLVVNTAHRFPSFIPGTCVPCQLGGSFPARVSRPLPSVDHAKPRSAQPRGGERA